jgi:presenilin 1
MLIAAVCVVHIRTDATAKAAEEGLSSSYYVVNANETDSNATKLGTSLINGLVIIAAICAMTFVIVLLYKYRCMKVLFGYMILSSGLLLGFLACSMLQVAIERFQIFVDVFTFAVFMFNFAIVGLVSIYAPAGIVPVYMNQAYLIVTSVIVAWELSFFDPWTAWMLLVLLAFYDLFAVLTPCGPLKALIKLST